MASKIKDQIQTIKDLRKLVKANIGYSSINTDLDSEVVEVMSEICNRRNIRKLKKLLKSATTLLEDLELQYKQNKALQEYNDKKHKESNHVLSERFQEC